MAGLYAGAWGKLSHPLGKVVCMSGSGGEAVVDLTENLALTLLLMDDTWAWRHRVVERLEIGPSHHLRVSSTLTMELARGLVQDFVDPDTAAIRALLPVTMRPKRLLIDFRLEGSQGESVHRLLRPNIAAVQSEYLGLVIEGSAARDALSVGLPEPLREAICVFTPGVAQWYADHGDSTHHGLARYLAEGLGFPVRINDVARWHGQAMAAGSRLADAIGEKADLWSSSENILLALPGMDPLPRDPDEIGATVAAYCEAVDAAAVAGDQRLLEVLADYGRRWEVVVETAVPLDEPFEIRVIEERPVEVDENGWIEDVIVFGDARTMHLEARLTDPALEIAEYDLQANDGSRIGIPILEAVRHTPEVFAAYTAEIERPEFAVLCLRLHLRSHVLHARGAVEVLVWAGVGGAFLFSDPRNLIGAFAILTVPSTFAVTVLLAATASPVAGMIERQSRKRILVASALLWAIVLWRLLSLIVAVD